MILKTGYTATAAAGAAALIIGVLPATASAGSTAPGSAQNPTATMAGALHKRVQDIVDAGSPGAALLIRDEDGTRTAAAGLANMASGRALRASDLYRVGSVTKSFVATLTLQLVGTGDLDLDATVADYLPALLPDGDKITLRELLNHTSGLFNYTDDPDFRAAAIAGEAFTPRELIAYSIKHGPLFPPGQEFAYSNTNYVVLGLLIRAAGGESIRQQLEDRILTPLDLHATTFPVHKVEIVGRHAHGYDYLHGPELEDVTTAFSPSWAWAAGALVSNESDLADFYSALLSGKLLDPALLDEMKKTVPAGKHDRYGLGIFQYELPCGTAWGHEGDVPGYHDWVVTNEDGTRQVAVMVNVGARHDVRVAVSAAMNETFCGTADPAGALQPSGESTPLS